MHYKVKWVDYPQDQSSLESEKKILGKCLIKHFEHGQKRERRKSSPQLV